MAADIKPIESVFTKMARDYLHSKRGRLREISNELGGDISYDWLRSLSQGRLRNPSVNSIQAVLEHGGLLKIAKSKKGLSGKVRVIVP